jgi:uncharacterized membrane protein YedE/YeeE
VNPEDFERVFNIAEAGLWIGIGLCFLVVFIRRRRSLLLTTAVLFVAFGITDIIESRTGAWWDPPALLVAKVAVAAGLLTCFVLHRRSLKTKSGG